MLTRRALLRTPLAAALPTAITAVPPELVELARAFRAAMERVLALQGPYDAAGWNADGTRDHAALWDFVREVWDPATDAANGAEARLIAGIERHRLAGVLVDGRLYLGLTQQEFDANDHYPWASLTVRVDRIAGLGLDATMRTDR